MSPNSKGKSLQFTLPKMENPQHSKILPQFRGPALQIWRQPSRFGSTGP